MVERAEHEPTMEEIVVALSETRRGAARVPPFTVVGGHLGGYRTSKPAAGDEGGTINIAALRDSEIERLLTENRCLNDRIVFLLKIIEREQGRNAELTAAQAANGIEGEAAFRNVKAALEVELRPILLVMLRLLEKHRAEAAGPTTIRESARRAKSVAAGVAAPAAALSVEVAA